MGGIWVNLAEMQWKHAEGQNQQLKLLILGSTNNLLPDSDSDFASWYETLLILQVIDKHDVVDGVAFVALSYTPDGIAFFYSVFKVAIFFIPCVIFFPDDKTLSNFEVFGL